MLEALEVDNDLIKEFTAVAPVIKKERGPPQSFLDPNIASFFKFGRAKCLKPFEKSNERKKLCDFLIDGNDPDFTIEDFSDHFIFSVRHMAEVQCVAAALIFEVCRIKFVYLSALALAKGAKSTGFDTQMLHELATFLRAATEGTNYNGGYMVVHQLKKDKKFYQSCGFVPAPKILDSWILPVGDLVVCNADDFFESAACTKLLVKYLSLYLKSQSNTNEKNKQNEEEKDNQEKQNDEENDEENEESEEENEEESYEDETIGNNEEKKEESVSTKAANHLDKHCFYDGCQGKKLKGYNWARHLKGQHKLSGKATPNMFEVCRQGECATCYNYKGPSKDKGKKTIQCTECKVKKRYDAIVQKKPAICASCDRASKKRAKRQQQDNNAMQIEIQDLLIHESPNKRLRESTVSSCNTTTVNNKFSEQIDTSTKQGPDLNQPQASNFENQIGQVQLIQQLQHLEQDQRDIQLIATELLTFCHLFPQDIGIQYFKENADKGVKLAKCISILLDTAPQLPSDTLIGLIVAAFVLGQSCWVDAVAALTILQVEVREQIIQAASLFIKQHYSDCVATWFKTYWKYSSQHQAELCKLEHNNLNEMEDILTLALVVEIKDYQEFIKYIRNTIKFKKRTSKMLVENLTQKPRQPKMTFENLVQLVVELSSGKNQEIINKSQQDLKDAFLTRWIDIIKNAKNTINIADAVSIQHFLDELQHNYGALTDMKDDITQDEDDIRFQLIMDGTEVKPNNKQFALAQYCVAKLQNEQRQLWVVPSGQGKSRIAASIACIAVMCGVVNKVYMVFTNLQLLERDREEFSVFMTYTQEGCIEYQVGMNFTPEANSLIIIDEVDELMFQNPEVFKKFVSMSCCIGLTATSAKSLTEEKVASQLSFKQYNYSLKDDEVDINANMFFVDHEVLAKTIEDKCEYIISLTSSQPVLVFCDIDLANLLFNSPNHIHINQDVQYESLRMLDQINPDSKTYTLLIASDEFGMRGFDYRSINKPIALVIARSFSCKRDVIQGLNRVGRFGDECIRVKFTDIQLIDKKLEAIKAADLFNFISVLKKDQIKLHKAIVKKSQVKAKTTYQSEKLGEIKQAKLLGD